MRLPTLLLAVVLGGCGRDTPAAPQEPAPVFRMDEEQPAEAPRARGHVIALVLPDSAAALKPRADTVLAESGLSTGLWTRDLGSSSLIVAAADGQRARDLFRALDDFRPYVPK